MSEQPCPFCNLDRVGHAVIYENSFGTVISSNPRLMFGHTLVVPKKHVGAIYELSEGEWSGLMRTVFRYQKLLIASFSSFAGQQAVCDVSWHTRPFMPTTRLTIPGHAHVHLRPRTWKDQYYEVVQKHETALFQDLTIDEMAAFRALFPKEV